MKERLIYQNLNTAKDDVERIEMFDISDGCRALAVCFETYLGGCRVDVVVPWQNACQYWRATGHNVCGVLITAKPTDSVHYEGGVHMHKSFAKWRRSNFGGKDTWRVLVGSSDCCVLKVEIGAEYLQHPELEALRKAA